MAVVLLVACANLAGLLIVRSSARQQEIAIRLSLGAARGRIVRQLLAESALLAAAGGAAGVAFAYWMTRLLLAMMSRGRSSIVLDVAPNARTLAFAAAVTIATAVLFGLLPALGASRSDVQPRLKRRPSGVDRSRNGMGSSDWWPRRSRCWSCCSRRPACSCARLQKLRAVDVGFHQDQVLVVSVSTGPGYCEASERALYEELYARFGALPGVQSVSMSMERRLAVSSRWVPGSPSPAVRRIPTTRRRCTTTSWGRGSSRRWEFRCWPDAISSSETTSERPSASLSARVWRDATSGARIRSGDRCLAGNPQCQRCPPPALASIVGVVKDVRYASLRADAPLMIYRPYRQEPSAPAETFLIRTSSAMADALTPLLRAEDPRSRARAPAAVRRQPG